MNPDLHHTAALARYADLLRAAPRRRSRRRARRVLRFA
jgi:hypothetical protein